eukprot:1381350-Pyramimonas_sp.AAC.1
MPATCRAQRSLTNARPIPSRPRQPLTCPAETCLSAQTTANLAKLSSPRNRPRRAKPAEPCGALKNIPSGMGRLPMETY